MSERDLKRLLALWESALGKEWVAASDWLRSLPANSVAAIESRLVAGDIGGLIAEVEQAALRFAAETQSAYIDAGQMAARWLDKHPAVTDRLIRFDAADQRVVEYARRNRVEFVRGVRDETREKIGAIMTDGARTGANPRALARQVRDSIGLTPYQDQIVRNYRRELEDGDFANAMARRLHDDRSNRRLLTNRPLTPKQIDDMTERYRQNWIAYRAETIARTESSRNVHAGLDESFRQAVARGDIDASQLVNEWIHAGRGKESRHQHQMMDGRKVKFGEPFVMPDGARMMYPGDPDGGASHNANCRCTRATTVDPSLAPTAAPVEPPPVPSSPPKNPRRQAAARRAAAASRRASPSPGR